MDETAVTLATSDGLSLEARARLPAAAAGGLVVCHPHPLYGGDMDNPVVVRLAGVGLELGLATLRFNFRGVGTSGGSYGGGDLEIEDAAAAVRWLRHQVGLTAPLVLAGYSFGAMVSARTARRSPGLPVSGLLLVAPPLLLIPGERLSPPTDLPLLVIVGDRDPYCPEPAARALVSSHPGAKLVILDHADHFFFGRLYPLGQAAGSWLGDLLAARQPARGGGPG